MDEPSRRDRFQFAAVAAVVMLLGACNPEASIQGEFDAFIANRNQCTHVSECTLVQPGCPLGCGEGVRKEHLSAARAKTSELIDRYELGGRSCAYSCLDLEPACDGGECVAREVGR